jgi:hypothetical protein
VSGIGTVVSPPILASTVPSLRGLCFTSRILPYASWEAAMPGFGFCSGVLALACVPDLEAPRRKRIPTASLCAGVCAGAPEGSPMPAATSHSGDR